MTDQSKRHDDLDRIQDLSRSPWTEYNLNEYPRDDGLGALYGLVNAIRIVLWVCVAIIGIGLCVTAYKASTFVPHQIEQVTK